MVPNVTLTLVDGVKVIVPDSIELITTYVIREQQDWFEDEIRFLRHLIQPGQRAIDIGANYGLYTLSIARLVGPSGRVWAFEPASGTAERLAASIVANSYSHVVLEQSALSDSPGTARLSLNDNSELNKLVQDTKLAGESETVPVVTLDTAAEKYGWKDIDFVKLDAEGQEANIIRGGRRFLASESPLIQYEIKEGSSWHLGLANQFAELDYRSYRLVPGLCILVPFDEGEQPDDYLLNLFCCKTDRAASLARLGLLVEKSDAGRALAGKPDALPTGEDSQYGWRATLATLPYGAILRNRWERTVSAGHSGEALAAMALYACSEDGLLPAVERLRALSASFVNLRRLCETEPAFLRWSSLARVARDYGAREVAVNALRQLCITIFQQRRANPSEPFLAPGRRFDTLPIPDATSLGAWLAVAALEELERYQFFSSYYSGMSEIKRLEFICNSDFGGDDMKRRRDLIYQRYGIATQNRQATPPGNA
jgi:FkbM family methyltransferase